MGQRDIRHTKNPDWLRSTSRNITDTNDYRAGLATELGAPASTTLLAFLSRGSQELICKSLNGAGPSERPVGQVRLLAHDVDLADESLWLLRG
jgi:hypothetical protein